MQAAGRTEMNSMHNTGLRANPQHFSKQKSEEPDTMHKSFPKTPYESDSTDTRTCFFTSPQTAIEPCSGPGHVPGAEDGELTTRGSCGPWKSRGKCLPSKLRAWTVWE